MLARRAVWLVLLPVLLAGCLAAHWAAYVLAAPDPSARGELLPHSAHSYLDGVVLLAGGGVVLALAAAVWHGLRGRRGTLSSPRLAASLPPVAFALQEHAERLLVRDGLPLATALEPTFALGLVLQVPFALLAWLLARALVGAAETLVALLSRPPRLRAPFLLVGRPPRCLGVPRPGPLAFGSPQRGPPSSRPALA